MSYNWSKIGEAEVFGKAGSYLPPDGDFKLKVIKAFTKKTRKSGDVFIVDFTVIESTHPEVAVGAKRNWFQSLEDRDVAFPAIKDFMLRLFNVTKKKDTPEYKEFSNNLDALMEEVGDEDWEEKDAAEHPLHGTTLGVETYNKVTKKGNDYTVHNWYSWNPEDDISDDD